MALDSKVRRIQIFPTASVADPAHQIVYAELIDGAWVQFTNFEPLKNLIHDIELQDAENSGYAKGVSEVLKTLGMTPSEYFSKRHPNE